MIKFYNHFNIDDKVFIMIDNEPTSCIVREIILTNPNRHCPVVNSKAIWYKVMSEKAIIYGLSETPKLYHTVSEKQMAKSPKALYAKLMRQCK